MTYSNLPKEIISKAFISPGGELAWKKEYILEVIDSLKKIDYAIIGGDIWILEDKGIKELYWLGWSVKEKKEEETWKQFVERSAAEFLIYFYKLDFNSDINNEKTDQVFYNISIVTNDEYIQD